MRKLSRTNQRLRGVPRRLRALERWAKGFEKSFPADLESDQGYWSLRIPVLQSLLEGRYTRPRLQVRCAQELINACYRLMLAKPESGKNYRVTCVICLPDMFSSELCIYLQEEFFQGYTAIDQSRYGAARLITDRSLAQMWKIQLPPGIGERGLALDYRGFSDPQEWFVGERWYFGEVH